MSPIFRKCIWWIPSPFRRAVASIAGRLLAALPEEVVAHLVARLVPPEVMKNKRYFHLWEAQGYHVTPVHYFEPIPDTRLLPESLWQDTSRYARGIDFREDEQIRLLAFFEDAFKIEYSVFPRQITTPCAYYTDQDSFCAVDAEVLYCMVRRHRPQRVVEIGSGMSSLVITAALARNRRTSADDEGVLTCVEPYPGESLDQCHARGLLTLKAVPVQDIPLSYFDELRENDICVIDSTHVLRIGGDVEFLYLQVLPRLRPGVLVHMHDIFLPAEYPRHWIRDGHLFWNEQYLLHTFLQCNQDWEVLWGSSYMCIHHAAALRRAFPTYAEKPNWPGSFWIRRKTGSEGRHA